MELAGKSRSTVASYLDAEKAKQINQGQGGFRFK
jgi:hypothetical protein